MASPLLRRVPPGLWVFLGAFLVQFLLLNRIAESRHFLPDGDDMKFYNDWAQKLMGTMPWVVGEPNYPGTAFYGLPGYAYALAAIYTVTGGYDHYFSPYLVSQLQAFFHAGTALFLFLIARRVFGRGGRSPDMAGTWIGVLAAASWVAFTPAQVFSAILMPTAWMVCAFWGTVFWVIRIFQEKNASWWRPWIWMGLVAGVIGMVVATIFMLLPLAAVCAILVVGKSQGFGRRVAGSLGAISFLLLGAVIGCSPAWYYNRYVADDGLLLSAHDGLNYYLGNHATATGYTKIPSGLRASQEGLLRDSLTIPEKELGRKLKRSEVSAYWKEKGRKYIRENPTAWLRLLTVKVANFWNAYQYDDLSILKLLRDEGVIPPGLRFGFFAALALPGLILALWRWPASVWVAGAVLLHMLSLMPVFVTERYRLAAAPGLILLSWGGLAVLWQCIAQRRWLPVGFYLAVLLPAVWFTSRVTVDIGSWSLDYYKAGIRSTDGAVEAMDRKNLAEIQRREALAKGDQAEAARLERIANEQGALVPVFLNSARKSLETALAYVQTNEEIHFALGNVWFHRGDFDRARICYENALKISLASRPHDGALNNLGVIAMQQKRWADAERYLQGSLQMEPEDAKTWFNLARVRREAGNTAGAREAATRALQIQPGNAGVQAFLEQLDKAAVIPP